MSKFVIECPECHNYTVASHVFNRHVKCTCGYEISVKRDRMSAKECAHCHNTVIFDQAKGDKALCPVCKEPVNTTESMKNAVEMHCPSCACSLIVAKNAATYTCPLCETEIDVQKQIAKEDVKNKGLASVIKYEGGNDVFVWKHPIEDFNLGSQLIVHESQEALFFRDGQAMGPYGAGRHTLATQNIPLLETLYKLPTNPDEVFHSEVYFINMTTQMGIKWGTDSRVRFFDPASGLHIELAACGQFNLRVSNSRKLVLKIVGTAGLLTQDEITGGEKFALDAAVGKFKALVMNKVKSNLARIIKENSINILEIDEYMDVISERMAAVLNEAFEEYGLTIPEFYITRIVLPENDPNFKRLKQQFADKTLKVREEGIRLAEAEAAQGRKIVEAQTEAQLKMVSAQGEADAIRIKAQAEADAYKAQAMAEAAEMQAKGYSYVQETARMVGMEAMQNGITGGEGGAGALGDVAGLGIALGTMGGVIGMTKEALGPIMGTGSEIGAGVGAAVAVQAAAPADTWDCVCGVKGITGKFCSECGAKKPVPADTWDCTCGNKGITGKFCSECGAKKPEPADTWDCACGNKGITGKFCSECGAKKPEPAATWDCTCGNKGITGKFCPECGKAKEE